MEGKLVWNFPEIKELFIEGKGSGLTLVVKPDGIFFETDTEICEVTFDDIAYVWMFKPTLFKKGYISFYGDDDNFLANDQFSAVIEVSKKFIDQFELIGYVLEDNGITVKRG